MASRTASGVNVFRSTDKDAVAKLERTRGCEGRLVAGLDDDFLSMYVQYYDLYTNVGVQLKNRLLVGRQLNASQSPRRELAGVPIREHRSCLGSVVRTAAGDLENINALALPWQTTPLACRSAAFQTW